MKIEWDTLMNNVFDIENGFDSLCNIYGFLDYFGNADYEMATQFSSGLEERNRSKLWKKVCFLFGFI